jgi:hypothetical protein
VERDFRAKTAELCMVVPGVVGGDKQVDVGLDGEARGIMSLGSGFPAE